MFTSGFEKSAGVSIFKKVKRALRHLQPSRILGAATGTAANVAGKATETVDKGFSTAAKLIGKNQRRAAAAARLAQGTPATPKTPWAVKHPLIAGGALIAGTKFVTGKPKEEQPPAVIYPQQY